VKPLVIDASVAVKWYLNEADSNAAAELLGAPLVFHAPHLLKLEVASAIWKNVVKGLARPAVWDAAQRKLHRSVGQWHSDESLLSEAFEIACAITHPIYDCLYLALARRLNAACVTADKRLLAKLAGTLHARVAVGLTEWRGATA
jgi:predicted nucleic acid-binding protein